MEICELEDCDNAIEGGEGTTIYFFNEWGDVVCDCCYGEYQNGDWVADVEARQMKCLLCGYHNDRQCGCWRDRWNR